ncbi:MAG TPA: fumarylacetoacetate hydrolase family protein [Beijerinckiaceae bacterium]|nr:fumarylacetoacetate hydrolase family protein [Beijerinckiaceae bacterium]
MNVQSKVPSYVIQPAAIPTLQVAGSDGVFPIRRVYCVGRNYAEHAIEMGHDPNREPPFFFQKNPDNVVSDGRFPYPPKTSDVHHEIELVVALGKGGADIPAEKALDCVYGYAVGLDMTRRDLQGEAKKMGRPWEVGKAVEASAPCGPLVPASKIGHPAKGAVWLDVNGQRRQTGDLSQLIWNIPDTIAYLSGLFTLAPGDLIMTGTPAGVGAVKKGDVMKGGVEGVGEIEVRVV